MRKRIRDCLGFISLVWGLHSACQFSYGYDDESDQKQLSDENNTVLYAVIIDVKPDASSRYQIHSVYLLTPESLYANGLAEQQLQSLLQQTDFSPVTPTTGNLLFSCDLPDFSLDTDQPETAGAGVCLGYLSSSLSGSQHQPGTVAGVSQADLRHALQALESRLNSPSGGRQEPAPMNVSSGLGAVPLDNGLQSQEGAGVSFPFDDRDIPPFFPGNSSPLGEWQLQWILDKIMGIWRQLFQPDYDSCPGACPTISRVELADALASAGSVLLTKAELGAKSLLDSSSTQLPYQTYLSELFRHSKSSTFAPAPGSNTLVCAPITGAAALSPTDFKFSRANLLLVLTKLLPDIEKVCEFAFHLGLVDMDSVLKRQPSLFDAQWQLLVRINNRGVAMEKVKSAIDNMHLNDRFEALQNSLLDKNIESQARSKCKESGISDSFLGAKLYSLDSRFQNKARILVRKKVANSVCYWETLALTLHENPQAVLRAKTNNPDNCPNQFMEAYSGWVNSNDPTVLDFIKALIKADVGEDMLGKVIAGFRHIEIVTI